jgi:thioredoxin 1
MVTVITKENVKAEVEDYSGALVIDIAAAWCGPCQQMKPIFEQVARDLGPAYKFIEINVDESRDLAVKYRVTSVPTFVFVKAGEIKGQERGFMSFEDLKAKVKSYLG